MAFPQLENSDHVVSVSIGFPTNSKRDALFHCLACNYCADWDSLRDHIRPSASAAASKFVSGFRLELMYTSLIVIVRSNLTHLHGFQLLMLPPYFREITFFICTNRKNGNQGHFDL